MDLILESYRLFKENNTYNFEFLKNISKLELLEIFEKIDDNNIIEYLKILQKKNNENLPCMYKDECMICYEEKTGILTLCNHFFCFDCYYKLACVYEKLDCPMCRRDINTMLFESILYKLYSEDTNNNFSEYDFDNLENEFINQEYNYIIDEYEIFDIDEWSNNIELDHYLSGN